MTRTPVVIGSHPGSPWLYDCLKTIPKNRSITVHQDGGYEITALRTGLKHHRRFLFLQDSTEVLHRDFWKIIDESDPTWLFGGPPMYLAVYQGGPLEDAIDIAPEHMTKGSSIYWEGELAKRLPMPTLWPDVHDGTARREHRHGRDNLVLENSYLRKWKGNWGQQ